MTDQPLGVSDFAFSPDGRTLAFIARVPDKGRYGSIDDVDAGHEDPRHITSLQFQSNGLGWVRDRRSHLFVVNVPDVFGEPTVTPKGRAAKGLDPESLKNPGVPPAHRLTRGDTDFTQPCFTADGAAVLVTAGRTEGPENPDQRPGAGAGRRVRAVRLTEAVRSTSATRWSAVRARSGSSAPTWASPAWTSSRWTHSGVYRLHDGSPALLTDAESLIEGPDRHRRRGARDRREPGRQPGGAGDRSGAPSCCSTATRAC